MKKLPKAAVNQLSPGGKRLLLLLAFSDSLLLFVLLAVVHFYLPAFDTTADKWLGAFQSPGNYRFFYAVTNLGNFLFVLPAAGMVLAYLIWKKAWKTSASLAIAVFGGALFGYSLKVLFSKSHNFGGIFIPNNTELGFPSGHTLMALLFFSWLGCQAMKYLRGNRWRWPAAALAFLIIPLVGFSRLMINVHLLSDVLSGWAAGFIWLVVSNWLTGWLTAGLFKKGDNNRSGT